MEATETPVIIPEIPEDQKVWQEYLQRCCEVGQLRHQLDQLDSQKREIEKNLDVTEQAVKKAAHKHLEIRKAQATKQALKAPEAQV